LRRYHWVIHSATIDLQARLIQKFAHMIPLIFNTWGSICENEVTANKSAIKLIAEERENGNDMFPKDTDFHRVRKFLATNTLTYLGVLRGAFAKRLSKDKLRELAFPEIV